MPLGICYGRFLTGLSFIISVLSHSLNESSGTFLPPSSVCLSISVFFFQAEDGILAVAVTGVQTCALPICVCVCMCVVQHTYKYECVALSLLIVLVCRCGNRGSLA